MPSSATHHPIFHSFPTRRSSDLWQSAAAGRQVHLASVCDAGGHRGRHDTIGELLDRHRLCQHIGLPARVRSGMAAQPGWSRRDLRRSEEHTSELQSHSDLVCRLLRPTTQSFTLSLHDALPISGNLRLPGDKSISHRYAMLAAIAEGTTRLENYSTGIDCASTLVCLHGLGVEWQRSQDGVVEICGDRKSTRLNSSHTVISYAVFCDPPPNLSLFPYTTLFRSLAICGCRETSPSRIGMRCWRPSRKARHDWRITRPASIVPAHWFACTG